MRLLLVALALTAHQPVVADCNSYAVAPAGLTVTCADAGLTLSNLHWRNWGEAKTTAGGLLHANDCTPSCAAGHFHTYPITISLTTLTTCAGGRRQYTRLTIADPPRSLGFRSTLVETTTCAQSAPMGPQLAFGRRGPDLVVTGSAWPHGSGCPTTVALSSDGTVAARAIVGVDGTFTATWHAAWGRTVVATLTCRGVRLYEAVASR